MLRKLAYPILRRISVFLGAGRWRRKIKELFRARLGLRIDNIVAEEPNLENDFEAYLGKPRFEKRISRKPKSFPFKPIALYLPQFHAIPENDLWWGKGFTEWTNTRKATPLFDGHDQPREPHPDVGYYDLSKKAAIKKQIDLARSHGVYGFCYYFYWFAGKRLLETPLDILLADKSLDFPFCICWANENWTRRWDGEEREVLVAQDYTQQNNLEIAKAMLRYIKDGRYIRIGDKPLILIYRPSLIPNIKRVAELWRTFFRESGIGEVLIGNVQSCGDFSGPDRYGFDLSVEFPPMFNLDLYGIGSKVDNLTPDFSGGLRSYPALVKRLFSSDAYWRKRKYMFLRGAMLGWDNSARRKKDPGIFNRFHPALFEAWLGYVMRYTRKALPENEGVFFINAWNEWAEGTYLEPDKKLGYAYLNSLLRSLESQSLRQLQVSSTVNHLRQPGKILVHLHLYYADLLGEMISYLSNIPYRFSLFVTIVDPELESGVSAKLQKSLAMLERVEIKLVPNRGRDISHIFSVLDSSHGQYDYLLHLHTKKSLYAPGLGERWRTHLLKNTLGSPILVKNIFAEFTKNKKTGILYPETFSEVTENVEWGGNLSNVALLLKRIGLNPLAVFHRELAFPAGSFFWLRLRAFKNLFNAGISYEDFEPEKGQINATMAHAMERSFVIIANENGYDARTINYLSK